MQAAQKLYDDLIAFDVVQLREAAHKREVDGVERLIRDAIIGYSEQYVNAPNDDVERELKERAARGNAWLAAHGFEEEKVIWSKEETSCL